MNVSDIVKKFSDVNTVVVNEQGIEQKIPADINLHDFLDSLPIGVYIIQDEDKTIQVPFAIEDDETEFETVLEGGEGNEKSLYLRELEKLNARERSIQEKEIKVKEDFYSAMMSMQAEAHKQQIEMMRENEEVIDRRVALLLTQGKSPDDDEESSGPGEKSLADAIVEGIKEFRKGREVDEDFSELRA